MKYGKWLACAAMLLTCAPVLAQRPEGGGRGGFQGRGGAPGGMMGPGMGVDRGGPIMLLSNAKVQEELALSEDQKAKVGQLQQSVREKLTASLGDFRGIRDLPQDEQRQRMEEMRAKSAETVATIRAEVEPKLAEILDGVQLRRLHQISWQVQGVNALQDKKVVAELKLTSEQQEKLKTVLEEGQGRGGFDRDATRESRAAAREEREKKALDVLTAEQKTAYAELKGPEFDVSSLSGGFGRGGEGRGTGGEGRGGEGRGRGGEGRGRGGDGERPQRPGV